MEFMVLDVKCQFMVFFQIGSVDVSSFFLINFHFFGWIIHCRINKSCYIVVSMSKRFNGLNDTLFIEQRGF